MKRKSNLLGAIGLGSIALAWLAAYGLVSAFAQTPPAAVSGGFVPYTVTLDQNQALMQYLVQQPYSFAEPVIRRLTEIEAEAQRAAATPVAPAAEPTK